LHYSAVCPDEILLSLSRRYVGTEYRAPVGPAGRVIFKIVPDKVNTAKSR